MPGQRLLAELDLFNEPDAVLRDSKYWTAPFTRHFIESWDGVSYMDARAGQRLSEVALELVDKLDEEARRVLRPRALATYGSSFRALGDLHQAERVLAKVGKLQEETAFPRLDVADYHRRMAYVRLDQRRYGEAVVHADQAIGRCLAEQADHQAGRAYGARGAIYLWMVLNGERVPSGEPIESLSQALRRVDVREGLHTYEAPTRNLALALLKGCSFELDRTLSTLRKALRLQAKQRITRKMLPNAQLRWTIGLVHLRLGSLNRAKEILSRTRRVLLDLRLPPLVAWISLDLAEVYFRLGMWGQLQRLAEEVVAIQGVFTPEGITALRVWNHAVQRQRVSPTVWDRVLNTVRWVSQKPLKEYLGPQYQQEEG